jgi:hypothetical protein
LSAEQPMIKVFLGFASRADLAEPWPAVLVGQRLAAPHLLDIGLRVQVVAIEIDSTEARGQRRADRRLAAAGDAHQQDAPRYIRARL